MSKKDIEDYIKEFIDEAKELNDSDIFNDYGSDFWSFKKLIFLSYYIKPFLNISINNGYEPLYIDLCAGCGINKIDKGKGVIKYIGSPLISIRDGLIPIKSKDKVNRFSKWFFIEEIEEKCNALNRRTDNILKRVEIDKVKIKNGEDVKVICGNCNEKINEIITSIDKEYKGKISVLVFIDPYSFSEVEWETIEKLYDKLKTVDLIYCFSSGTLKRALDSCDVEKLKKVLPPSLRDKSKGELSLISEEAFEEAFAKDIKNAAGRSISYFEKGITTRNRVNAELYRIMFFSHLDVGVVESITKRICDELGPLGVNDLEAITACATGKAKSLKQFLK